MTEFTPQTDPRCSKRISVNRSVKVQYPALDTPLSGKLLNISHCGAGLLCNQAIDDGEIVTIEFSLPNYDDENPLTITSKIAHNSKVQNQFLIGIEFTKLSLHEKLIIKGFTTYHERFQN